MASESEPDTVEEDDSSREEESEDTSSRSSPRSDTFYMVSRGEVSSDIGVLDSAEGMGGAEGFTPSATPSSGISTPSIAPSSGIKPSGGLVARVAFAPTLLQVDGGLTPLPTSRMTVGAIPVPGFGQLRTPPTQTPPSTKPRPPSIVAPIAGVVVPAVEAMSQRAKTQEMPTELETPDTTTDAWLDRYKVTPMAPIGPPPPSTQQRELPEIVDLDEGSSHQRESVMDLPQDMAVLGEESRAIGAHQ